MATLTPGHDSRYCGSKKRQGDGTCTRPAGWGTDHVGEGPCKLHGGNTRSVRKGATLRLVEHEARELFGREVPDPGPVDNPLAAYATFAGQVMAWMGLMDSLLDDLRDVGYEHEAGEQIFARVQLYERAMDRANTVLSSYARLRIDERLAQISQEQADRVIDAIEAALTAIGIRDTDQRGVARKAAAAKLRAV